MKSVILTVHILLVSTVLHLAIGSKRDGARFNVHMNENGTSFTEKININEKDDTISFSLPGHNGVDRSDVLHDFNLNLTITRLPAVGICSIKPLDKSISPPKKMKTDMSYVRRTHRNVEDSPGIEESSTWAIDKQLKAKDLPASVLKFCVGFPVYRTKDITNGKWQLASDDDARRRKRDIYEICIVKIVTYTKSYGWGWSRPCVKKWYCKIKGTSKTSWYDCQHRGRLRCVSAHQISTVVCCQYRC